MKPEPLYVTVEEGGEWIVFQKGRRCVPGGIVHSMMFEDGTVWDAVNGWRPDRKWDCPHCAAKHAVKYCRDPETREWIKEYINAK